VGDKIKAFIDTFIEGMGGVFDKCWFKLIWWCNNLGLGNAGFL
jgi:hypothetical protein